MKNNEDPPNNDKLFKGRPFIDKLRASFKAGSWKKKLCIDKQMVLFKGLHSDKEYVSNKPKKWGFNFVLTGSFGYIYKILFYLLESSILYQTNLTLEQALYSLI